MSVIISIIGILLTIFFVVGIHEAAHFGMARLLNVKVLRFSIGFGKPFYSWRDKSGTEYALAPIPLGGYVKMLDEGEGEVPADQLHLAYNRQPYYKKFLIVLAGPAINIISAFLLYCLVFTIGFTTIKPVIGNVEKNSIAYEAGLRSGMEITSVDDEQTLSWTNVILRLIAHIGDEDTVDLSTVKSNGDISYHQLDLNDWHMDELKPDPLSSIGISTYQPDLPLVIGVIASNSPAKLSDLREGDKIIALNKKPVDDWTQLIKRIKLIPGKQVTLTVMRDNKKLDIPITIGTKTSWTLQKSGFLGIGPTFAWPKDMLRNIQYPPIQAASHAFQEMTDFVYFNFLLIGKLLIGKMSLYALGGPITIFDSAGQALNSGFIAFIGFLAFISIAIGIINVLPIPGLDGGHLLIQTIEAIIRRPLPDVVIVNMYRCGMFVLLLLLIQAFVNDILRLY